MELVGRQFGHLRVTEALGQGGMGDVYAAWDEKLERKVAIKVLNADQRLDDESRGRLLREARSLSKLDHSNICRIHDYIEGAGDEEVDLLVLEYIDGETLHAALERGPMSRSEKLRIAIKVAEVLIDAHRAGIVHRDLKPENVMLTKSGEVKVLDFGLARWFNKSRSQQVVIGDEPARLPIRPQENVHLGDTMELESAPSLRTPSGRREFQGTAIGITLGTPIFMSPEQARGEDLTPASDMFSFGLLLQTLFTGKDPHPVDISAREVILRVARGETLPVENAPRDVTTLINRLKRFAPADRPTAVETLERLRFFADKPQRIIRRSIAAAVALVLLIGAWRYMVDLRRERAIAIAAQQNAERRRAQAEDLINFMVGDLRTKLEPVGRLDVLDDVAEKALEYIGARNRSDLSQQELIAHARALSQLGEVRMGQGKSDEALEMFQRSFDRASVALERDESDPDARFTLALTRFWLSNVHRVRNELPAAFDHAVAYQSLTSGLASQFPSKDEYQLEAAYAHTMVGVLFEAQRRFDEALTEYRRALATKQTYAGRKPDDANRQEDVARTLNKMGFALWKAGSLSDAQKHFEREVAIREVVAEKQPKNMRGKQELAVAHAFLATVLEDQGIDDRALEHRRADVTQHEELAAFDPDNATSRRNLAIARASLGRQLAERGEPSSALTLMRSSETELRDLLAIETNRPSWRADLMRVKIAHGRVQLSSGEPEKARAKAREIIDEFEPQDRAGKLLLGSAWLLFGDASFELAKSDEARQAWLKAADLVRPDDLESSQLRELDTWARVLIRLRRGPEASTVITTLRSKGYRNTSFVSFASREGY